MDHCIDRGDHYLLPFEDLPISIGGRLHGSFSGAALVWAGSGRNIEITLGDPPFNGVDNNDRTELCGGYLFERIMHDALAASLRQHHAATLLEIDRQLSSRYAEVA